MRFFSALSELEQALSHDYSDAAVISERYPLRCNLTGAENVALVRQYHHREKRAQSLAAARVMLDHAGHGWAAEKRDGEMSEAERFATKLVRARILEKSLLLIDRPGAMLPNTDYAPWLYGLLQPLTAWFDRAVVLDYEWNRPLYRELLACEPSSSK